MLEQPTCTNCGRRLRWHYVANCWTHDDDGITWCYRGLQGYDQPRATPMERN